MQPDEIVTWLRDNPEFFDQYADELAEIYVPHTYRGQAISLAERQLLTLREKNRSLELRLGDLLEFGTENDHISEKLHQLSVSLMQADDLASMIGTLEYHLQHRFGVPHIALRLWLDSDCNLREFAPVGEAVQKLAQNLVSPYCGPYVTDEVQSWFECDTSTLKSFAQFALRTGGEPFGVLVMASEDIERFYPDMGTLYLQRLSDLVSASIRRAVPSVASDDEPMLLTEEV